MRLKKSELLSGQHCSVILMCFLNSGFLAVLYLTFFKQQISLSEFFLAEGVASLISSLYILLAGAFHLRRDIRLGFMLSVAALMVLLIPFSKLTFYAYTILRGVGVIIFFTPYNIAHFAIAKTTGQLESMTRYWALLILPAIIGPIVGGYFLNHLGIGLFASVGLALMAIGIFTAQAFPKATHRYTRVQLISQLRGLRTITMIDGALHKAFTVISIVAVLYIGNEFDYGIFLSLAAVLALVVGLGVARRSDRSKRRMIFIWPVSILLGIISLLFYGVHTFAWFLILALLLRGFSVLAEPARSTIMQDTRSPTALNWIARELYLNLGRGMMWLTVAALAYGNVLKGSFVLIGLLFLVFPLVVVVKKVYTTRTVGGSTCE